jgi:beta-glucosidase
LQRYNRINGVWACEQPWTLKKILKEHYNFSGFVVSDWGACHSTVPSINGGR